MTETISREDSMRRCGNKRPTNYGGEIARTDLIVIASVTVDFAKKMRWRPKWHWCMCGRLPLEQAIKDHERRGDVVALVVD